VATEVRSLAQRSAAAAKEIKTLIDDSVARIADGSKLADEAGTTMSEVVSSVKRVNDIMGEITAASQEQSQGIAQVNDAIAQMDQVTQQNAALVEEAAAAAASLQDQAGTLSALVGTFRLGANDATAPVMRKIEPTALTTRNEVLPLISKNSRGSGRQIAQSRSVTTVEAGQWEEF